MPKAMPDGACPWARVRRVHWSTGAPFSGPHPAPWRPVDTTLRSLPAQSPALVGLPCPAVPWAWVHPTPSPARPHTSAHDPHRTKLVRECLATISLPSRVPRLRSACIQRARPTPLRPWYPHVHAGTTLTISLLAIRSGRPWYPWYPFRGGRVSTLGGHTRWSTTLGHLVPS